MMGSRLIVVSNRLPVSVSYAEGRTCELRSSGGLVSALEPVLSKTGGYWIGWPGAEMSNELSQHLADRAEASYHLVPVSLSPQEVSGYYHGCANSILWPLFHGLSSCCKFDPDFWECYQNVNSRFADAVLDIASPRDFVWVQDYHLMTTGASLRDSELRLKLGYFHHVPFPEPETFGKLPWRREILEGLLCYNVVGFQTLNDKRNFVACLRRYLPEQVGIRRLGKTWLVTAGRHSTVIGAFPISIDYGQFSREASSGELARIAELRSHFPGQRVLLGVDRLDYTKGILERLSAYELLLKECPEVAGRVHLVQVVVPSRESVESYAELRREIERRVSQINGEFGRIDWSPITYLHRHLSREELIAFYRAADVAVVTPVRDGMNLVAKEFCASRNDERGVLVLSEFAGAAEELACGALLTNPYDVTQLATMMRKAITLPALEARARMRSMREHIKSHDVWRWSAAFRGTQTFTAKTAAAIPAKAYAFAAASEALG